MTLRLLKDYMSKKEEIDEIIDKLAQLGKGDSLIGNDVILTYNNGYPVPQSVVGVDREKFYRLKSKWEKRKRQLEEECQQVEDFIEDIPDSITRRIFRKCFLEGLTQEQISEALHISQSSISKKISNFMKLE